MVRIFILLVYHVTVMVSCDLKLGLVSYFRSIFFSLLFVENLLASQHSSSNQML